jgi:PAS domain S-box-containing protein
MENNLAEIIDIPSLQVLLESLWKASGIPVGIFDLKGRMLAGAGRQEICTILKTEHPAIARLCSERNTFSRNFSAESRTLKKYKIVEHHCKHGVLDILMPLYIEGRHRANLFVGKFLYEKPDETFLHIEAHNLGLDEKEYVRAIEKIPVVSRQRIEKVMELNVHLIDLLIMMGMKTRQQRTAEQALRQALEDAERSRDRIQAILRSVADGLIVTDMDNNVVMINRQGERLLGVRAERVIGRPLEEVFDCEHMSNYLNARKHGSDEAATADLDLCPSCLKGRRQIQARISRTHNRGGDRTGLIILLRDITRERDLDRMKNEFISTAAHELRTPLTSILGFSELLLQDETFSRELQQECLSHIHKNAENLHEIVEDLFILSRFQAGEGVPLRKAPCDLSAYIGKLVDCYRSKFPDHQFSLSLPNPMPTTIIDCDKVMQVMENLLSNAVKFSPEGGSIRVEGTLKAGFLRICVTDRGIGMTREQLERIFDKFYRADASDTAAPGLGLGMALARNIVEAHGGTIRAASQKGVGTTITFTLPAT